MKRFCGKTIADFRAVKYAFTWGKMSIFYSFPGTECGFSFLGKTAGRVPGKTAVRDGTAANDGYFARKISRGSGGGARRRKTGQTGDFCVESVEKKEKMDPQAA